MYVDFGGKGTTPPTQEVVSRQGDGENLVPSSSDGDDDDDEDECVDE